MANTASSSSSRPSQLDFWEFVTCAKCHLSYSADGAPSPSVPFWLTECGHIVCNSHLNADQSCPSCNAQNIELMPLQKELPAPMSDWFCSVPIKLDALAQAVKFQQEALAAEVRHYKQKCSQYRMLLERMKNEINNAKSLKRENEELRRKNEQLRGSHGIQEPGHSVNSNGKRRMTDYVSGRTSSPRSIHTPLGPPRITLPPDHDPPPSLPTVGDSENVQMSRTQSQTRASDRPGSSRFTQQFAYNSPQQPQIQAQHALQHGQHVSIGMTNQNQADRRLMPPPPTPVHIRQSQAQQSAQNLNQRVATPRVSGQNMSGPSTMQILPQQQHRTPVPQLSRSSASAQGLPPGALVSQDVSGQDMQMAIQPQMLHKPSRRFAPPMPVMQSHTQGSRFIPSTPSNAGRRFVPATPSASASGLAASTFGNQNRFIPPGTASRRPALDSRLGTGFGHPQQQQGQRTAFLPSGANGFS